MTVMPQIAQMPSNHEHILNRKPVKQPNPYSKQID